MIHRHSAFERLRPVLQGLLLVGFAACADDPVGPGGPDGDAIGIVLNSVDRTLTVFSVDEPTQAFSIGLAPDGSPVNMAVRGTLVAVPLGFVPAIVVADVATRSVLRTIALPGNSGATGVAFLNDSIAIVGNPGRNTVSAVNVVRGTSGAEIAVGAYPQAAVSVNDTVFVLNANLGPDFSPAGPGSISVITGSPAQVVRTIALTGFNSGAIVATDDGRLVVVNSGSFGGADGSLSIVSRTTLAETQLVTGFGDFPGSVDVAPNGQVHVGSFSYGVAIWNPTTQAFIRAPADAVEPAGIPSVGGLGFDDDGRFYTLEPDCRAPSRALRLTTTFDVDLSIPTGICPIAIAFTRLP